MREALPLAAQDLQHRDQAHTAGHVRHGGLGALDQPLLGVLDGHPELADGADEALAGGLGLPPLAFGLARHAVRASLMSSTVALASTIAASGVGAPAFLTERSPISASTRATSSSTPPTIRAEAQSGTASASTAIAPNRNASSASSTNGIAIAISTAALACILIFETTSVLARSISEWMSAAMSSRRRRIRSCTRSAANMSPSVTRGPPAKPPGRRRPARVPTRGASTRAPPEPAGSASRARSGAHGRSPW